MTDLVSVIIPTYNRPDNLRRALDSVLVQKYGSFEVLVVNDSRDKDPVLNIIGQLNDSRIKYLDNSRTKGANGARNTGVLAATGKLIAFLDDDDEWMPEKLKDQVDFLQAYPDKAAVFSGYLIKERYQWTRKTYRITELTMNQVLLSQVSIGASSNLMFRKEVFEHAGLWNEELKRQQDLELLVRVLSTFKIGFDSRINLKVYGHTDIDPMKAISSHREYYQTIEAYVGQMSQREQNQYYSKYFRRLSMYYIRLNLFKQAFDMYREALKYQLVHRKDVRNMLLIFKQAITLIPWLRSNDDSAVSGTKS